MPSKVHTDSKRSSRDHQPAAMGNPFSSRRASAEVLNERRARQPRPAQERSLLPHRRQQGLRRRRRCDTNASARRQLHLCGGARGCKQCSARRCGTGTAAIAERDVSAVEIWAKWVETGVDNQVFPRSQLRLRQKMVTTELNDQCGVLDTRRRTDTRACTPERNRLPGQALARGRKPSRCLLVCLSVFT